MLLSPPPLPTRAAGGAAAGAKRKAAAEPVPGARARMQKMFQSAQAKAKPARAPVDDASADALLDDILGNLGGGGAAGGGARCACLQAGRRLFLVPEAALLGGSPELAAGTPPTEHH